jgi:hypothetical protein
MGTWFCTTDGGPYVVTATGSVRGGNCRHRIQRQEVSYIGVMAAVGSARGTCGYSIRSGHIIDSVRCCDHYGQYKERNLQIQDLTLKSILETWF